MACVWQYCWTDELVVACVQQ